MGVPCTVGREMQFQRQQLEETLSAPWGTRFAKIGSPINARLSLVPGSATRFSLPCPHMVPALVCRALAGPALTGILGAATWKLAARCSSLGMASAARSGPGGASEAAWHLQQAASSSSAACLRPPKVADLIDMHCGGPFGSPEQQASRLKVLAPGLRHFGGVQAFYGQVATIQCFESNVQVGRAGQQLVGVLNQEGSLFQQLRSRAALLLDHSLKHCTRPRQPNALPRCFGTESALAARTDCSSCP